MIDEEKIIIVLRDIIKQTEAFLKTKGTTKFNQILQKPLILIQIDISYRGFMIKLMKENPEEKLFHVHLKNGYESWGKAFS